MPTVPTRAIETMSRRAEVLEELCALQQIELQRHGLILNPALADARVEMTEAVDELVNELEELAEELEEE